MSGRIYLDWNASAPLRAEARAAMRAAMDCLGNPSSQHAEGRAARAIIDNARDQVAALVDGDRDDVVFTSGATEAAALVLEARRGVSSPDRLFNLGDHAQHPCIAAHLDEWHVEPPEAAERADTFAWSAADGESGILRAAPALPDHVFGLVDATQAVGKTAFSFRSISGLGRATHAILSAHKIGGPKGVGAALLAEGGDITPLIAGGGQERGRRCGTENVIGIAGFGAACAAARRDLERGVWDEVRVRRDRWESALGSVAPDAVIFGAGTPRLPNTSLFAIPGWRAETQAMQLDLKGIAASAGSACSSGKAEPSPMIRSLAGDEALARCALRVSLGPDTTATDIDRFIDIWTGLYRRQEARAA